MPSDLTTPPAIAAGALAATAQPTLTAAGGLLLRPWADTDVPVFLAAYDDPDIRRWHTRRPASEDRVRAWFAGYGRDWAAEHGAHWAVTGDDGRVAGRIALRGMDLADGTAVCAYWVLPPFRGAGVATRALQVVSAWALGDAGFHRLELDHSTRNEASCRVALRAGFLPEGTKRSAAVHADGRHDMHLHARTREDSR
ncbi:GNAT family N-acetyltransferase [Spirilliplanes yamanashiensis]|uniref:Acetyltransferase n=1 Tax=Spirilliplanes yamanashiensis TaxID=42233 RepID=A0A8J3Y7A9_9ACTN|nr:GNAT family N-acetyltransferase [Spirilliplanes yamanashiensis]MDP9815037.1 RimJ/RimL family protein N-acetyltransferase [Spirilliplanes yamanashiensis]GIJ02694.1 acetyltransferase [Spirilliplanes yamanashiensis]